MTWLMSDVLCAAIPPNPSEQAEYRRPWTLACTKGRLYIQSWTITHESHEYAVLVWLNQFDISISNATFILFSTAVPMWMWVHMNVWMLPSFNHVHTRWLSISHSPRSLFQSWNSMGEMWKTHSETWVWYQGSCNKLSQRQSDFKVAQQTVQRFSFTEKDSMHGPGGSKATQRLAPETSECSPCLYAECLMEAKKHLKFASFRVWPKDSFSTDTGPAATLGPRAGLPK